MGIQLNFSLITGLTRFFNTAGDFVSDFFGEGTAATKNKKKPNEGIVIDRKTDEKLKKKPEIVKKTAKTSTANKLKSKTNDDDSSLEYDVESTLEDFEGSDDTDLAEDRIDENVTEENDEDDEGYQADKEEDDDEEQDTEKDENVNADAADDEDNEKDYEDDEVLRWWYLKNDHFR